MVPSRMALLWYWRDGPGGHEILLRVVNRGAVVPGGGTLMADTTLELVEIPGQAAASN